MQSMSVASDRQEIEDDANGSLANHNRSSFMYQTRFYFVESRLVKSLNSVIDLVGIKVASDVAIRPSKTSLWATSWSGDRLTNGPCEKQKPPSMHHSAQLRDATTASAPPHHGSSSSNNCIRPVFPVLPSFIVTAASRPDGAEQNIYKNSFSRTWWRFGREPMGTIKIVCWKNKGVHSVLVTIWGSYRNNGTTMNNNKDENNRSGQEVPCCPQVPVHTEYQNTTIALCFLCYIIIFFNNILDLLCL